MTRLLRTLLPALVASVWLSSPDLARAEPVEVLRLGGNYVNVFALRGDGVVLVDAHNRGKEKKLLRQLSRNGIQPTDIRLILLTHGHSDHAGSAQALSEACGCPIATGVAEVAMTEAGENPPVIDPQWTFKLVDPFLPDRYPPFTPDVLVSNEGLDLSSYGIAGRVFQVGGHSPGSVVVHLDDGQMFVGDTLRGGFYRPRRPREHFLHEDHAGADAVIDRLLSMNPTMIWPGHGRGLTAERVRAWVADGRP